MRLCDESEDANTAVEQTGGSAASSCSRNSERLAVPRFGRHHLPADWVEFATAIYLLMKHNQSQELIDVDFNLEPSVTKPVCVRTSSKGYPPYF